MATSRFRCCERGIDGYPPYVLGWFRKAHAGTMRRGYRDVGYLITRRLHRFRPSWLRAREWRCHLETLRRSLDRYDELAAFKWLAATYPDFVAMIPADQRGHFLAGIREGQGDD